MMLGALIALENVRQDAPVSGMIGEDRAASDIRCPNWPKRPCPTKQSKQQKKRMNKNINWTDAEFVGMLY